MRTTNGGRKRRNAAGWIVGSAAFLGALRILAACAKPNLDDDFIVIPHPEAGQEGGGVDDDGAVPDPDGNALEPCVQEGGAAIRVGAADKTFCIDRTEVTRSAYAAFLASKPSLGTQLAECRWNTTFVPNAGWPDGGPLSNPDLPVSSVDWCDAVAYCTAMGKRLCGAVGGGPAIFDREAGAARSGQWYVACSRNGAQLFPYGNAQDLAACNGPDGGGAKAVGSAPKCQGGYPGLVDMTGNVQEWRDSCQRNAAGAGPQQDFCRLGGGAFGSSAASESCETIFQSSRSGAFVDLGFRCCGP